MKILKNKEKKKCVHTNDNIYVFKCKWNKFVLSIQQQEQKRNWFKQLLQAEIIVAITCHNTSTIKQRLML